MLVPDLHAPLVHADCVQGLPSSQAPPSAMATALQLPSFLSHKCFWHAVSPELAQLTMVLGFSWHLPVALLQNSVPLQASPSSAAAQSPSPVQQMLVPGVQVPAAQWSPWVHARPSLQVAVVGKLTLWHLPLPGAQTLAVQGLPSSLHATTVAGLTTHAWLAESQYKVPLHRLPSSFAAQSAEALHAQIATPPAHWPAAQVVSTVQGSLSSHTGAPGVGTFAQAPVLGSQLSAVQALASLQVVAAPLWHTPAAHTLPWVHGLPSSHSTASVTAANTQPRPGSHTAYRQTEAGFGQSAGHLGGAVSVGALVASGGLASANAASGALAGGESPGAASAAGELSAAALVSGAVASPSTAAGLSVVATTSLAA